AVRELRGTGGPDGSVRLGGPRRLHARKLLRGRPRRRMTLRPAKAAAMGALAVIVFGLTASAGSAGGHKLRAPQNVRLPRITEARHTGARLRATRGTWTGKPTRFRFSWQRCRRGRCGSVHGAHHSAYRIA